MKKLWHLVFGHGVVPMSFGVGFEMDKSLCKCGLLVRNGLNTQGDGMALLMPRRLSVEEKGRIREEWTARYGGPANAHRAIDAEDGPPQPKQPIRLDPRGY